MTSRGNYGFLELFKYINLDKISYNLTYKKIFINKYIGLI